MNVFFIKSNGKRNEREKRMTSMLIQVNNIEALTKEILEFIFGDIWSVYLTEINKGSVFEPNIYVSYQISTVAVVPVPEKEKQL